MPLIQNNKESINEGIFLKRKRKKLILEPLGIPQKISKFCPIPNNVNKEGKPSKELILMIARNLATFDLKLNSINNPFYQEIGDNEKGFITYYKFIK
jgi:hypothetical protein